MAWHWMSNNPIIWTKADLIHWYIYAALGGDELIADCTKPIPKPTCPMCGIHLSAIYQKIFFTSHNNMCLKINF